MKQITFLFAAFLSLISYSQINYQAQYTQNGSPVSNASINVQIDILDLTISGTSVYQETFTTTTNATGIFTIAIGKGTHAPSASIDSVKWATDKFVALKINNVLQGTTQIMQVPTAKYAETSKKPYVKDLVLGVDYTVVNWNTTDLNYPPAPVTYKIIQLSEGNDSVLSVNFKFKKIGSLTTGMSTSSEDGLYDRHGDYDYILSHLSEYTSCYMYINTLNGLYRIKMK